MDGVAGYRPRYTRCRIDDKIFTPAENKKCTIGHAIGNDSCRFPAAEPAGIGSGQMTVVDIYQRPLPRIVTHTCSRDEFGVRGQATVGHTPGDDRPGGAIEQLARAFGSHPPRHRFHQVHPGTNQRPGDHNAEH
jgi:hypothetical protein